MNKSLLYVLILERHLSQWNKTSVKIFWIPATARLHNLQASHLEIPNPLTNILWQSNASSRPQTTAQASQSQASTTSLYGAITDISKACTTILLARLISNSTSRRSKGCFQLMNLGSYLPRFWKGIKGVELLGVYLALLGVISMLHWYGVGWVLLGRTTFFSWEQSYRQWVPYAY